jgi:DnaK suppressor protein
MSKTNGATTTKSKTKDSSKDKAAAKTDKKSDKKSDKGSEKSASGSSRAVAAKPIPPKPVVPQITYKCPFPADELVKWRQILLAKRHEVTDDIAGLVKDAMDAEDGHTTPNHIAERGSDADLQDLSLGVAGEEKDVVWQIDRALRKIDANRPIPFGLCEHTKEVIPKTRLQLIPWTPLSIEGATHMEKQSLMLEDLLIED